MTADARTGFAETDTQQTVALPALPRRVTDRCRGGVGIAASERPGGAGRRVLQSQLLRADPDAAEAHREHERDGGQRDGELGRHAASVVSRRTRAHCARGR